MTPDHGFQLVAHRGQAATHPENTLTALQAAIDAGATWIEVDLQVSADGVPVLHHDGTLERLAGRPEAVHELTAAQLAEVELPGCGGIPTLDACLDLLDAHPHVTCFLEIKRESLHALGADLVENLLDVIASHDASRHPVISFDRTVVERTRGRLQCPIGFILEDATDASHRYCQSLEPEYVFCNVSRAPVPLWPGSWDWALYEVIDADLARELAARGAAFIETMDYQRLSRELGSSD